MKTVASDEHLKLSNEIKALHSKLRHKTKKLGAKRAWQEHIAAKLQLQNYAQAMKELAVNHWEPNELKLHGAETNRSKFQQRNRIAWTRNFCRHYFQNAETIRQIRERELRILNELKVDCTEIQRQLSMASFPTDKPIQLLDVGSCYNPFKLFDEFHVTAIDIAPASDDVYECDFLHVPLGKSMEIAEYHTQNGQSHTQIQQLRRNDYHVIVFSLLLEYLPTSEQRLKCCEKAYDLLQNEGILCIITPDSKHLNVNAKLMKTWRYALAQLGFGRIKIEKLEHITCMVFRKCVNAETAKRWARIHKESYMEYKMEIPQDFTDAASSSSSSSTDSDDCADHHQKATSSAEIVAQST